ncbi:MAG: prepilin-type N-terminal cleavage/methylation domain-containing protein [Magnetococcales bacterium]|nr:prepilin-type N-terminal cleavage/methylation domain-containing protein [Magnetococcales bacterium]
MSNKIKNQKEQGFSMVELAIVLAIIALIVGAVAVGKDLQRNAEYRKIANKFIGQWAQAYNQYYERTGVVIGDSFDSPTGQVGAGVASGGAVTGFTASVTGSSLADTMIKFGIRIPQGNGRGTGEQASVSGAGNHKSDSATTYRYLDQSGIPHLLRVSFVYTATSANGNGLIGNMMLLENITPKLGSTTDSMIDGVVEYNAGYFRGSSNWANTGGGVNASTVGSDNKAAEETAEANLTATWKMNQ